MVRAILSDPATIDKVREVVAWGATYVFLSHDYLDLKRLMFWAVTSRGGLEAIAVTYSRSAASGRTGAFRSSGEVVL